MKNNKIITSFEDDILTINFIEGAIIDTDDLLEIYAFANKMANNQPYCILYEALGHHEVSEEAIEYLSNNKDKNILAKAYILSSKESEIKTKLHLLFDAPAIRPLTFKNVEEGRKYLLDVLYSKRK